MLRECALRSVAEKDALSATQNGVERERIFPPVVRSSASIASSESSASCSRVRRAALDAALAETCAAAAAPAALLSPNRSGSLLLFDCALAAGQLELLEQLIPRVLAAMTLRELAAGNRPAVDSAATHSAAAASAGSTDSAETAVQVLITKAALSFFSALSALFRSEPALHSNSHRAVGYFLRSCEKLTEAVQLIRDGKCSVRALLSCPSVLFLHFIEVLPVPFASNQPNFDEFIKSLLQNWIRSFVPVKLYLRVRSSSLFLLLTLNYKDIIKFLH